MLEASGPGTRVEDHKTFSSAAWPVAVAYPRSSVRSMSETWLADLRAEVARRVQ